MVRKGNNSWSLLVLMVIAGNLQSTTVVVNGDYKKLTVTIGNNSNDEWFTINIGNYG